MKKMKVLLLNGSRREKGCTYTALSEIAQTLNNQGIDTEIIHAVPTIENVKSVAEKVKMPDSFLHNRLYMSHQQLLPGSDGFLCLSNKHHSLSSLLQLSMPHRSPPCILSLSLFSMLP